ncbi:DUF2523 domain-containing protein [Methyloversatilis thermotolerans]|uniref:DUF2523 domain-containing protein n=1 Tax=Methyloversatilis thermotolerans TaxID=1346290 RepID=UPI00035F0143|nr:DUF2523 domain-containing protein [Methyloversatilis thermotolerans]
MALPLIPIIAASSIGGILLSIVTSLVGRVLLALGLGLVTYQALDPLLETFKSSYFSQLSGLPSEIAGFVGLLRVGEAVQIIFAALATKLFMSGVQGLIKRWVVK